MKKIFALILTMALLLTGCAGKIDILGTWEQTITISVLGVENQTEAEAVTRFLFLESGTGMQEMVITDGSHPNTAESFTWSLEERKLTIDYGEGKIETFSVSLEKDTLTLDGHRADFVLNKAD